MLAVSMEDFVNNIVEWLPLPSKLEHPVEILIYMIFLTVLMLVPLFVWLGAAVATTRRRQEQVPPPPAG
jgi:ABC-type uncharacterized transport system permease subunit